jgi:hypothetical protein
MNRVGGERRWAILHEVIHFVVILHQFLNRKPRGITMRILALIVPSDALPRSRGSSDQRDRFGNDVQTLGSFSVMPISVSVPNWMSSLSCIAVVIFWSALEAQHAAEKAPVHSPVRSQPDDIRGIEVGQF